MARRRVAKRVRIEGDDGRDILSTDADVRCRDIVASYQLGCHQAASKTGWKLPRLRCRSRRLRCVIM